MRKELNLPTRLFAIGAAVAVSVACRASETTKAAVPSPTAVPTPVMVEIGLNIDCASSVGPKTAEAFVATGGRFKAGSQFQASVSGSSLTEIDAEADYTVNIQGRITTFNFVDNELTITVEGDVTKNNNLGAFIEIGCVNK